MGIPLVDFAAWHGTADERRVVVAALGDALEDLGFVALENHGIPDALLSRAYAVAAETFALPDATKRAYETPWDGRQRGYTAFGVEHARDHAVPDLKEFWHVGRDAAPGIPENRFPAEIPDFAATFAALFEAMDQVAAQLLEAIGLHLGLPADRLPSMARGGNSVLRVLHYPPLPADAPPGAVRAAEHEDINLITILPITTRPGLQLLTRDGEWVDVDPPPGVVVCDTGDMMQLLTGGRVPATTHRVVNPEGPLAARSRYSMPFFVHPRPEVRLDLGSGTGPTAEAFLARRLEEIGLT